MRRAAVRTPSWLRVLGTVVVVVLPLVVVEKVHLVGRLNTSPLGYAILFLVVGAAAQVGLVLRWWGTLHLGRLFFDLALLVLGGLVTWGVTDVALHRGGGPVDPALTALIMAYLVAVWSGQRV